MDNRPVKEHMVVLGMDPEADAKYMWIAQKALTAPLPFNWEKADDENGHVEGQRTPPSPRGLEGFRGR